MSDTSFCAIYDGVILRRVCRREKALTTCPRCGTMACDKHFSTAHSLCHNCISNATSSAQSHSRSETSSSTDSTDTPSWSGMGGAFSGGGSSGSWGQTASDPISETTDPQGFTASDYAAFEQISTDDMEKGATSYDS